MRIEARLLRIEERVEPQGPRCAVLYYKPGVPISGVPEGSRRVIFYPQKKPEGAPVG